MAARGSESESQLDVTLVQAAGLRLAHGHRPSVVAQMRMLSLDSPAPRCLEYLSPFQYSAGERLRWIDDLVTVVSRAARRLSPN